MYLFIYLSMNLSCLVFIAYISKYPSIYFSILLPIYLFQNPIHVEFRSSCLVLSEYIYASIYLSILSICVSTCFRIPFMWSAGHLAWYSLHISMYPSIYLYILLPIYLIQNPIHVQVTFPGTLVYLSSIYLSIYEYILLSIHCIYLCIHNIYQSILLPIYLLQNPIHVECRSPCQYPRC